MLASAKLVYQICSRYAQQIKRAGCDKVSLQCFNSLGYVVIRCGGMLEKLHT